MKKTAIILGLVIVIASGTWAYGTFTNSIPFFSRQETPRATPVALQVDPNATVGAVPSNAGTPNSVIIPATGSSDAALEQYTATIDTQMLGLVADASSTDLGMSRQ
jgi:hypothetical protein